MSETRTVTLHGGPYDGKQIQVSSRIDLPFPDPAYDSPDGSEPMLVHTYRATASDRYEYVGAVQR